MKILKRIHKIKQKQRNAIERKSNWKETEKR